MFQLSLSRETEMNCKDSTKHAGSTIMAEGGQSVLSFLEKRVNELTTSYQKLSKSKLFMKALKEKARQNQGNVDAVIMNQVFNDLASLPDYHSQRQVDSLAAKFYTEVMLDTISANELYKDQNSYAVFTRMFPLNNWHEYDLMPSITDSWKALNRVDVRESYMVLSFKNETNTPSVTVQSPVSGENSPKVEDVDISLNGQDCSLIGNMMIGLSKDTDRVIETNLSDGTVIKMQYDKTNGSYSVNLNKLGKGFISMRNITESRLSSMGMLFQKKGQQYLFDMKLQKDFKKTLG